MSHTLPIESHDSAARLDCSPVEACRKDFPVLNQEVNGYPLVYLDNAASSQAPFAVIDEIARTGSAQGLQCGDGSVVSPADLRGWLDTLQTDTGSGASLHQCRDIATGALYARHNRVH